MKKLCASLLFGAAVFAAGSAMAAQKWGLTNEEEVRFDGTVVDVAALLQGAQGPDCGGGKHQLGVQKADGTLLLAVKNTVNFSGNSHELAEYCGQEVTIDGLIAGPAEARVLVVQFVRPKGGDWRGANRSIGQWSKEDWAKANGFQPDGKEVKSWFKFDKRVTGEIEKNGFLGIGKEADEAFLKEW
jgi:hypothetical protein